MSLLNDASLVMIPSGYKDTKLYSVKPTDGSGDFTFSRGSNLGATRINSDGLIEKGRENLLLQSNGFNQAGWGISSATITGGQSGYDGSSNAWLLDSSSEGYLFQYPTSSNVGTLSIYAKANSVNNLRLRTFGASSNAEGFFDLANGVVGSSTNLVDLSIESIGGGWYRCSVVYDNAPSLIRIYPSVSSSTSSGTIGSIYIQDAQLEVGLVSTDVITTTTTTEQAGILEDMPRLDYSGGASCPSLLLEPQRSNLVTQSEYIGAWTESALTITDNNATSPEGVLNAAKLTLPSGSATKRIALGSMPVTAVARSYSFFVKSNDITAVQLVHSGDLQGYARFDISTGVVGSSGTKTTSNIEDYGNGWYRCIANFDSSNAFGSTIYLYISDSATGSYGGSTSAEGDLFVYGAQYEEGSYPTSYIPTYGSSVTKSKDSFQMNLQSQGIFDGSDTEGVLMVEYEKPNTLENVDLMRFMGASAVGRAFIYNSGVNFAVDWSGISSGVIDHDSNNKTLWRLNSLSTGNVFHNGTKLTGNSTGTAWSDIRLLRFNMEGAGGVLRIKQILLFPTALTDAECIELTTI